MNGFLFVAEFMRKEVDLAYYRLASISRDFGLPAVPLDFKIALQSFFKEQNADIVKCSVRISKEKIFADFDAYGLLERGVKGRGTWEFSIKSSENTALMSTSGKNT